MFLSGRAIAQAINLTKATGVLHCLRQGLISGSAINPLRTRLYARSTQLRCLCSKNDDGKPDGTEAADKAVSPHLKDKFILFKDRDSEVILDVTEEFRVMQDGIPDDLETLDTPSNPDAQFAGHSVERGKSGVYDIEEIVAVLDAENAFDICVIQMPKELRYAQYMVIASGRSVRHLKAMMQFIRKLYKRKRNKSDEVALTQGKDSVSWMALDMGNIVLHLMMPEHRERFDIETLWSVGEQYDDHSVKPQDPMGNILQGHLDFLEKWRPMQEIVK